MYAQGRGAPGLLPQGAMSSRVYVGNLPWQATEQHLLEIMSPSTWGSSGHIVEAKIIYDRDTGKSKGFGFLTFSSDSDARFVISNMNGRELLGRAIKVNSAQPPGTTPRHTPALPYGMGGFGTALPAAGSGGYPAAPGRPMGGHVGPALQPFGAGYAPPGPGPYGGPAYGGFDAGGYAGGRGADPIYGGRAPPSGGPSSGGPRVGASSYGPRGPPFDPQGQGGLDGGMGSFGYASGQSQLLPSRVSGPPAPGPAAAFYGFPGAASMTMTMGPGGQLQGAPFGASTAGGYLQPRGPPQNYPPSDGGGGAGFGMLYGSPTSGSYGGSPSLQYGGAMDQQQQQQTGPASAGPGPAPGGAAQTGPAIAKGPDVPGGSYSRGHGAVPLGEESFQAF